MAAETLDVQNAGNGGADFPYPPTDFFDPDRRLREKDGMVTGALSDFGMRSFELIPIGPTRENTGHNFSYTEKPHGRFGTLSLAFEDSQPNLN